MIPIYSDEAHKDHCPEYEFTGGHLTKAYEVPDRVSRLLSRLTEDGLGQVFPKRSFPQERVLSIHHPEMVQFLGDVFNKWQAQSAEQTDHVFPTVFRRGKSYGRESHRSVQDGLARFCYDTATPILSGTWQAARSAADIALTAASALVDGQNASLSLARPPGHHAGKSFFGGYCYLNNAAIAAEYLSSHGLRPAILDVDYHHGNGTQDIFYDRADVLFLSIHGHPESAYPYCSGFADETGCGTGDGFTHNFPLPPRSVWTDYAQALSEVQTRLSVFGPDALIISLGLDTSVNDPLGDFALTADDFERLGNMVGQVNIPILLIFEGGYALSSLPCDMARFLSGFLSVRN